MSDRLISREDAEHDVLLAAAFIAERIASSDGRAEAMSSIVPRLLERGNVDLAAALADTIDDPYSRDRLLISIAERCVDIDDDEYAQQLADAVEDDAVRSQAFENVAIRIAARGDIEKARGLAESVGHSEFVEAAIAARMAADGSEDAARASIQAIEFANARVTAYQEIAGTLLTQEQNEKAVEYLNLAVESANDIEHDEEKIRALCDLGSVFIDARRNDLAVETFLEAREQAEQLDNIHREYFLGSCAVGLIHAGDLDEANATLDLISDKTQMASAMLGLARDEWKRGEKETAVETLDEAYEILRSQHEKETRDSRAKNALFTAVAVQYAGFGKHEKGIEIAQQNVDIDEQISSLAQISRVLAIQNEVGLSMQTIEEIRDEAGKMLALIGVSDELAKRESNDDAVQILDEVAQSAAAIDRPVAKSQVLTTLATRFIDRDRDDAGRRAAVENLAVISTIRDESSRASALASASDIYADEKFVLAADERASLSALINAASRN